MCVEKVLQQFRNKMSLGFKFTCGFSFASPFCTVSSLWISLNVAINMLHVDYTYTVSLVALPALPALSALSEMCRLHRTRHSTCK